MGLLGFLAYLWIYSLPFTGAPIRSDGYSYYVYLPSLVLYHDATLASVANDCCGGTYPDFAAITRWPTTGRWVDAHPIGVAILQLPAFLVAHALTRWSNLPPDGFSFYYQHAAGLAGLAYFVGGLTILQRVLRRHFSADITLATLAAITFGTNLFHYGVYDSTFSHTYSFFLITALLAVTESWWPASTTRRSLVLGLIAGLIVLVRHPNALFLLLIPLYGIVSRESAEYRLRELWSRRRQLATAATVAFMCVVPQLWLYHQATGHWIVSSYGTLGFTWTSPHVWGVLFSVQKGLFFWSPLLIFSIAGAIVGRGWTANLVVPAVVILGIDTFIIACWWDWQYGGSFGHRGFTDAMALFAVFLAGFYEWAARRPQLMRLVSLATVAAVALSVAQMIQYWLRILPFADTTWDQYRQLFLKFR